MKSLITFLSIIFLFATVQAKVVYLNNNLEEPNIGENLFINWSDAYAAVSAGDTIYVVGSKFNYGRIGIEKALTIIGPGYFLNLNSSTQSKKESAKFELINLLNGSDGTYLKGVSIPGRYGLDFNAQIDNITVEGIYCEYIEFTIYNNFIYDNITIKKCYLSGVSMSTRYDGLFTNLTFTNNIITGGISVEGGSSGIISNNLIIGNTFELGTTSSLEIANNIYLNDNENNFSIQPLPDASVHHNISLSGAFGNDNNNLTAPQSTLFTTDENATADGQYMLSENSPAKGTGTNGNDIGPFGGPDPYRLSGLPNLPNIYELSTVGLVSGDKLPVTIKIKQ